MTAKEIYRAEKIKFNNQYKIDFSLEDYKTSKKTEQFNHYIDTLSAALSMYINNITKMENRKIYDTSDISIGDFIKNFENLFDKKYVADLKDGDLSRRAFYSGSSFNEVANTVWDRIKSLDKPLPEVWADSIVNEGFTVDQMKEITTAANNNLANVRNERDLTGNNKLDLTNVVLAQKAMEKLREKRGFWWKVGHLRQNSREKKYLKALKNMISSYRQRNLPVDNIVTENSKTALADAKANLDVDIKNNGKTLNNSKEKLQEATATLTNSKQANQLLANNALTANIKGQIGEIIGNISKNEVLNEMVRDMLYNNAVRDIKNMWTHFENDKGFNKEMNMKNDTNGVFLNVQFTLSMLSLNPKDRIVTAQKITDLMLKQYSPVASDQKYEKYGDNYYVKNTDAETIKKVMQIKENADEAIAEARLDLGIDKKVQLDVTKDVSENTNDKEKSSKVDNIEVPNLNQVKNQ